VDRCTFAPVGILCFPKRFNSLFNNFSYNNCSIILNLNLNNTHSAVVAFHKLDESTGV
jgi:hypothetical protein